jgi:hypothetical protein
MLKDFVILDILSRENRETPLYSTIYFNIPIVKI